ncbi:MAG TPA: hypothetical protein VGP46_13020, partial [Acidimicrobiales bacterium]|nr:hypothetical protein [Acidimicrobiales bacterium]
MSGVRVFRLGKLTSGAAAACVGIAIVAVPVAGAAVASHPLSTAPAWKIRHPLSVKGADGRLGAESCVGVSFCMAVGSSGSNVLVETLNGRSWSVRSSPATADGEAVTPTAVVCTATTDCLVVGYDTTSDGEGPFASSWNGTTFSNKPLPSRAGSDDGSLSAVSCASATSCMAVGSVRIGSEEQPAADSWNGSRWQLQL